MASQQRINYLAHKTSAHFWNCTKNNVPLRNDLQWTCVSEDRPKIVKAKMRDPRKMACPVPTGSSHAPEMAPAQEVDQEVTQLPEEELFADETNRECHNLIVYNDEYNTFDHVISTLVRFCKHSLIQAEQCTHIIHFRGKCAVKKGYYSLLKPMQEGISGAGIRAEIV